MTTQTEMVMKSLVDAYNTIKALSDRINQLETKVTNLPWETNVSYKTPEPTPAVRQLASSMTTQMVPVTKNTSKAALQKIYSTYEKVVIWKSGIVTTMNDDPSNPLCIFKSRACARIALRKIGYNVPYSLTGAERNAYNPTGNSKREFIIAYKN